MNQRLFLYLRSHLLRFPLAASLMLLAVIIISVCDLAKPILASRFIEVISQSIPGEKALSISDESHSIIYSSFLLLVGSYLVSGLAWSMLETALLSYLQKMRVNCLQEATSRLYHFSHSFFQNNLTGSIISRLADLFQYPPLLCMSVFVDGLHFLFAFIFSLIVFLTISPLYTFLIALYATVFLSVILLRIKTTKNLLQDTAAQKSQLIGQVSDYITNIFAVRSFARKQEESDRFTSRSQEFLKVADRHGRYILRTYNIVHTVTTLYMALILYFLSSHALSGIITPGDFALIFMANYNFTFLLYRIAFVSRQFIIDWSTTDKALQLLQEESPDTSGVMEKTSYPLSTAPAIEMKGLCFSYEGSSQKAPFDLKVDLKIASKEKIGLVGYSGGGKSTITHLLQRLYSAQKGVILWDQVPIEELSIEELRKATSFVPQDPALFHRSIEENIKYGRPGATEQEVLDAAKKAQLGPLIEQIGLKTVVGERGLKLSGGQRQRIAIARAFLKKSPLLILDEATSQLDSCTEKALQESLSELMEGKTTIVIAHRLSTLIKMDRLVVLSEGKIVQQGSHQELMQQEGLYRSLWQAQVGGFIPTGDHA